MDARALLRRYLEQRREMGESELVLDGLSVEEVMKLVGVRDAVVLSDAKDLHSAGSNWRATLSEGGAAPTGRKANAGPSALRPQDDGVREKGHRFDPPAQPAPLPPPRPGITVGETRVHRDTIGQLPSLEAIAAMVAECRLCPLWATAKNHVPGEGNPNADLVCVGEAPGENEDLEGRPFVGPSGQLLTKILAAIDLRREDVFIANVLKHRPPGNRNPAPDEVTACSPYLVRQIELIQPKVILAFGKFAAQTLLNSSLALTKLRGQIHTYHGVPLIATFHPAALLRNPSWKRPTWEDVQLARSILDRATAPGI